MTALVALARMGERWAGEQALTILDESGRARRRGVGLDACRVLSHVRVAGGAEALSRALTRGANPDRAACAAWALGRYVDVEGVEAKLRDALRAFDPMVACNGSAALARYGKSAATRSKLRELLDSPNPCFRRNAVVAMGRLKARESLSKLRYLAQRDRVAEVRVNALRALWRIEGRDKLANWLRPQSWRQRDRIVRATAVDLLDGVDFACRATVGRKEFFALWMMDGDEPARDRRFRVTLPSGISFWWKTGSFGFAAFDELVRGSVAVSVSSPSRSFPVSKGEQSDDEPKK